jgi:hypothetical protein
VDYIAEIGGLYFEGTSAQLRLITPTPLILPVRFVTVKMPEEHIFIEDYFNSSTRIRRGRIYKQSNHNLWYASNVNIRELSFLECDDKREYAAVNQSFRTSDINLNYGEEIILGNNLSQSHWTVVLAERRDLDAYYITMKSKTFLGVLPELDLNSIPPANRSDIVQALESVVRAAPMQAPQSVIDACRNAASHMISTKFPESNPNGKHDLGALVKWLIDQGRLKKCTNTVDSILYLLEASTSHLVNQLHSRSKANAAAAHGTRPVSQRDADLAVCAIAFLLQDFEWAERQAL